MEIVLITLTVLAIISIALVAWVRMSESKK